MLWTPVEEATVNEHNNATAREHDVSATTKALDRCGVHPEPEAVPVEATTYRELRLCVLATSSRETARDGRIDRRLRDRGCGLKGLGTPGSHAGAAEATTSSRARSSSAPISR